MKLHSAKLILVEYVEKVLCPMQCVAQQVDISEMHQSEEGKLQFCSLFYLRQVQRSWGG